MTKSILLSALLLSGLAFSTASGAAISDPTAAKPPIKQDLPSYKDIVTGNIYVDVSNQYTRHGITPGSLIVGKGSFKAGFDMNIDTKAGFDIIGKFSQTNYPGKEKYGLTFSDQTDTYLGLKKDNWWPGMYGSVGFSYIEGGLAGLASQYREFHNVRPIIQDRKVVSIHGTPGQDYDVLSTVVLMQKIPLTDNQGMFVVGSASCSIDSTEGWLTNFGVGHAFKIGEHIKIITTMMTYFSYNFWGDTFGSNHNGSDGYVLNFDIPVNISKELVITPYIGMTWAGNNPMEINKKESAGQRFFDGAFENFAIIFGGKLKWDF